jgi:hypothetical protein
VDMSMYVRYIDLVYTNQEWVDMSDIVCLN